MRSRCIQLATIAGLDAVVLALCTSGRARNDLHYPRHTERVTRAVPRPTANASPRGSVCRAPRMNHLNRPRYDRLRPSAARNSASRSGFSPGKRIGSSKILPSLTLHSKNEPTSSFSTRAISGGIVNCIFCLSRRIGFVFKRLFGIEVRRLEGLTIQLV
jgi:hypothetical protein